MSDDKWSPIETAPKDGTRVDLWAKVWLPRKDEFAFRRFTDCYWWKGDSMTNSDPSWTNLDKGFFATHWTPIPEGPLAVFDDSHTHAAVLAVFDDTHTHAEVLEAFDNAIAASESAS